MTILIPVLFGSSTADTILSVFGGLWSIVWLSAFAIWLVGWWYMFRKAGRPGYEALVPIYNVYILLRIIGRPAWWLALYLVPFVNLVVSVIVALDLAKVFGKSPAFGIVALWLFNAVGYIILGLGDATYHAPATKQ